jgi:dephospho-CoA kinase
MLKIGLTGGIGAGKTTVSNQFLKLGVPVIDTDVIARELVTPGSAALNEIVEAFGKKVLTRGGTLDRKRLGQLVFSNDAAREKLEAILHPRIRKAALHRIKALKASYCILVVPLLIETDFIRLVDKVLVVDASDHNRIKRIKARSGLSEAEARNILDAQTSRSERLSVADYVIENDGTEAELQAKVNELHRQITAACKNGTEDEKK